MIRIISGKFRGRRLATPSGSDTRPSADQLREALFNIIGPAIEEATFLDLFAGTGAVGLEALSRGATHATFVEQAPHAIKTLNANILTLDVSSCTRVISAPISQALPRLGRQKAQFDIIFADPPYLKGHATNILQLIAAHNLLAAGGTLFIEEASEVPPETSPHLELKKRRRYGRANLAEYTHA